MRKQILVVDSDKRQIRRISLILRKAVQKWGGEAELYIVETISEADRLIRQRTMDLLVIDTGQQGASHRICREMEWVKIIRSMKKYVLLPVVLLLSTAEPLKYVYMELNCLGLLPRAFHSKEFLEVLEKGMRYRTYREEENYIFLRNRGVVYPVKVKDIVYVETMDRILHVYQKSKPILKISHKAMADILQESKADCLLQCSKNLLINKRYVVEVNLKCRYLKLEGEIRKMSVGKKYITGVRELMESRELFAVIIK